MKSKVGIACLLLQTAAYPAGIYLRAPGTGFCSVTKATNTTPIRLTVRGTCNLTTNATIVVDDVHGNWAANVHPGSGPTNTTHRVRKVANLSSAGPNISFDLLDESGAPVAGNGVYTVGGRVGVVTLYNLKAGPVGYLDGRSSAGLNNPRTAAVTTGGHKVVSSNPTYEALTRMTNQPCGTAMANCQGDMKWGHGFSNGYPGSPAAMAALRWFADGNAAALARAKWYLQNADQATGSASCDDTLDNCGTSNSLLSDYPMQYWGSTLSVAYTLMRGELTPLERATFLDYIYADMPWTKGGHNYGSANPLAVPWKYRAAVLSADITATTNAASNTITCNNCSFDDLNGQAALVGDIIIFPDARQNGYAAPHLVTARPSANTAVVDYIQSTSITPLNFQVGKRWAPGMRGYLFQAGHQPYDPLIGGLPGAFHPFAGQGYSQFSGFYASPDHNRTVTSVVFKLLLGIVTCEDDPRGCVMASKAYAYLHDQILPGALSIWTGWTPSSTVYHQQRMLGPVLQGFQFIRNSFDNPPDALAGTTIWDDAARQFLVSVRPRGGAFLTSIGNGLVGAEPDKMSAPLAYLAQNPGSQLARNLTWQFKRKLNNGNGYTGDFVDYSGGGWAWEHFLLFDPGVMEEEPVQTSFPFRLSNAARCATIFGAAECATKYPDVRRVAISRTAWTDNDATAVAFNSSGYANRDHGQQEVGGYIQLIKSNRVLLGGDSNSGDGDSNGARSHVQVGPLSNFSGYPSRVGLPVIWGSPDTNNRFWFQRVDLRAAYLPAATVTEAWRELVHVKGDGRDYVVDHVKVATSTAQPIVGPQYFVKNSTVPTVDAAARSVINNQPFAGLASRYVPILSSIFWDDNRSSSAATRVSICSSLDNLTCAPVLAAEWAAVHSLNAAGATVPEVTRVLAGKLHVFEIDKTSAQPAVVVLSSVNGNGENSASFTTTHTGTAQYVVTGLGAGLYNVDRGATRIGQFTVDAAATAMEFSSVAGAISIRKATGK